MLDLGPDPEALKYDGGAARDGSTFDAGGASDASRAPDAARGDASPVLDGGSLDALPATDARPFADAAADGSLLAELCADAIASAFELGPGTAGSVSTCGGPDLTRFDCLGTMGVPEAYYFVNATTDITVTISAGAGADGFVFSRIDPDDCGLITCGQRLLVVPAGEVAYFVVENVGGGCGATYSIQAISGSP